MASGKWFAILMLTAVCLAGSSARADHDIDVGDNSLDDWEAMDPSAFEFHDDTNDTLAHRDIVRVEVTDNNDSGSNGYLFFHIEFRGTFYDPYLFWDIEVHLDLLVNGTPVDIEVTSDPLTNGGGGEWNAFSNHMEVAIPYASLGLSYGSDTLGVAFYTVGADFIPQDHSPEPGEGDDGYIIYDGASSEEEPRAVRLLSLAAEARHRGVQIDWATGSERRNAGFNLYRLEPEGRIRLNRSPIPGLVDAALGRHYTFFDRSGQRGDCYLLEDLDTFGRSRLHGPVEAVDGELIATTARLSQEPRFWPVVLPAGTLARPGKPLPVAKLAVRRRSLVRIDEADVADLGLDPQAVSSQGLWIEREAGPIAVWKEAGSYFFVGDPRGNRYADYEVVHARAGQGLLPPERDGRCHGYQPVSAIVRRLEFEENRVYNLASPVADPFFWAMALEGVPATLEFDLPGVLPAPARLEVVLSGTASRPGPDHQAGIWLNGESLGRVEWEGSNRIEKLELEIPVGLLHRGENRLLIKLLPREKPDVLFIDRIGIAYRGELRAIDGEIRIQGAPGGCLRIGGLTGAPLQVLDVSNPKAPVRLVGYRMARDSRGSYDLVFGNRTAPAGRRNYWIVENQAAAGVQALGGVSEVDLRSPSLAVDYLVITHPLFSEAASRLAQHHRDRGLDALVVTTGEVYDAFSFGRPSARAIRELLNTARRSWARPPAYVLLMGGATVDSNNVLGFSPPDFVPAPFRKGEVYGYEYPADGWYANWTAVGRLPVQSVQEADALVDKILAWQSFPPEMVENVLFVADQGSGAAAEPETAFVEQAERLIEACLPRNVRPERFFVQSEENPADGLLARIEQGVDAVHFLGHAYLSGWSAPAIMTSEGADALQNQHPFLLFSWSCFDGAFAGPWGESLSWAMVRNPGGGAVAAVASASLTDPQPVEQLSTQLTCLLTSGQVRTLGQALRLARERLDVSEAYRASISAFNLLGDPATPNPWAF